MKISYVANAIQPSPNTRLINFDCVPALQFTKMQTPSVIPGNFSFNGTQFSFYDSTKWIVLQDVVDLLVDSISNRVAADLGTDDSAPKPSNKYTLPDFFANAVDTNAVYTPTQTVPKYLTVSSTGGKTVWKQWTSLSELSGDDPNNVFGGCINIRHPYIKWGSNIVWQGTVNFSKGWNVGFANNSFRVMNVATPVSNTQATNKVYATTSATNIPTLTESVFNPKANIDLLHTQLLAKIELAKASKEKMAVVKEAVRRYR